MKGIEMIQCDICNKLRDEKWTHTIDSINYGASMKVTICNYCSLDLFNDYIIESNDRINKFIVNCFQTYVFKMLNG